MLLLQLNFINLIYKGGDQSGTNKGTKVDDILMYSNTQKDWKALEQKLQTPRSGYAVSIINYSLTLCGNTHLG